jgi:uncharacterized protein YyaL (SSP411 family)
MLYDNAQLARVYLHAWQVTGNEFFRTIAEEGLDYVVREMTDPAGGFYATQDADSEGEEGKFFLWTPDEIRPVPVDNAAFLLQHLMTDEGRLLHTWEVREDALIPALPRGETSNSLTRLRFGQWLQALSYALSKPREIAIFGDPALQTPRPC